MSCPAGWVALASTCYHITRSLTSHAQCVEECGRLNASLACIERTAEQELVVNLASSSSDGNDVWTGRVFNHAIAPNAYGQCVSGEARASFYPWAPDQPNAPGSEHCVALWVERSFLWRDAPCSLAARCLCESSMNGTRHLQPSANYMAFAAAEEDFHRQQMAMARTWLLISYLLMVPAFASAPFLLHYLCQRRTKTSTTNVDPTPDVAPSMATVADPSVATADEHTVMTLRAAEEAARKLWTRTMLSLLLAGTVTFWSVTLAPTLPLLISADAYRAVKLYTDGRLDKLSSLVPWSLALLGLALQPTDQVGITRACDTLCALLASAVLVMTGLIAGQPAYTRNLGTAPVWALLISMLFVVLLLLPMTSLSFDSRKTMPREQLARFWLCLRSASMVYAIFSLLSALKPLLLGQQLVFTGSSDIKVSFILSAVSCASAAATFSHHVRARIQMWLGACFLETRGSKVQEASLIASLFRGVPAADAYVAAKVRRLCSLRQPMCSPLILRCSHWTAGFISRASPHQNPERHTLRAA